MMMNSASLQVLLNVGCMYFVTYIPTDVTGSAGAGVSGVGTWCKGRYVV